LPCPTDILVHRPVTWARVRSVGNQDHLQDEPAHAVGEAGHRFSTDASPAFGGQDAAPSQLFYALGSLTSCNQVTATLVAKDLGIRLGTWSFEVQGDLDTSVLVGGADGNVRSGISSARW
jgi:hypothetical protein